MRSLLLAISVIMGMLATQAAAKDEYPNELAAREKAVRLEPVSRWNIDYGESRCRLARVFGEEGNRHAIFFEQGEPAKGFSLTIGGPELQPFHRAASIELGMENDEPMGQIERVARAELGEFGPALIIAGKRLDDRPADDENSEQDEMAERKQRTLNGIDLAEAASIDRLVIKRGNRVLSFETGNMKAPFEALNQCTRALLEIWGLDPAQHDLYTPISWTNREAVARRISSDYPSTALRRRESGIFRLRVIVEPDGTMSECRVDNATVTESLQSPACQEMKRAEFEPALDANGDPMRSYYTTRIIYQVNQR